MANTYTQLYIELIFATKFRDNKIPEQHRKELDSVFK